MKGWQTKNFSDVLDIKNGRNQKEVESDSGEYPIYGSAGNVMGYANSYICEAGTTIVGRKGNINSPIYAETRFWNVDTAFGLAAKPGLDSKFLYYYCISFDFSALNRGTTIPSLVKSELLGISIPLPPLPEQHRIVAILDAAFDHIANARANCEANLLNARAIFESHLQAVFTQRGDGWVETNIGKCIRFIDYRGKTPTKTESGVRLITAKNVKMGFLQKQPMEFIALEAYDSWMTRGIPNFGDVLFTTEAPLANVTQLDTYDKVAFAQRVIIMQPDITKLDPTFLKYLLLSSPVQQRIRAKGTGATVQGIKASLLKLIDISYPNSISEQKQVVEKLNALNLETQRLESLYQRKRQALDDLKKSLLHQAFSGAL
jgi:type I restriction enzyme, S subunit